MPFSYASNCIYAKHQLWVKLGRTFVFKRGSVVAILFPRADGSPPNAPSAVFRKNKKVRLNHNFVSAYLAQQTGCAQPTKSSTSRGPRGCAPAAGGSIHPKKSSIFRGPRGTRGSVPQRTLSYPEENFADVCPRRTPCVRRGGFQFCIDMPLPLCYTLLRLVRFAARNSARGECHILGAAYRAQSPKGGKPKWLPKNMRQ
jgi:hypothetical protein